MKDVIKDIDVLKLTQKTKSREDVMLDGGVWSVITINNLIFKTKPPYFHSYSQHVKKMLGLPVNLLR